MLHGLAPRFEMCAEENREGIEAFAAACADLGFAVERRVEADERGGVASAARRRAGADGGGTWDRRGHRAESTRRCGHRRSMGAGASERVFEPSRVIYLFDAIIRNGFAGGKLPP